MRNRTQMALIVCLGFTVLTAPAGAQTLGGLGHPSRKANDDAPRQAPPEPVKSPEPERALPPPPPAPEPPPPEAPPAPAPSVPSENAPIIHTPLPGRADNAPVVRETPGRSTRVTTPIGQRPEARPVPQRNDGGDYLYPPPTVVVVPPIIVVGPPADPPPVSLPPTAPVPAPPSRPVPPLDPAADRWPDGSPQAAFADIERAWTRRDPAPLRRHVRDGDANVSVAQDGKYAYSLTSRDFLRLTRAALGRLDTVSFRFTRLRRAASGDVTAFGRHLYRVNRAAPRTHAPAGIVRKTVYVSYTLRRRGARWFIVGVGSSLTPLVR